MNRCVRCYFVPIISRIIFDFLFKVTSRPVVVHFRKVTNAHQNNRANTYIPDVTMEIPEVQQHGYRSNLQDDG